MVFACFSEVSTLFVLHFNLLLMLKSSIKLDEISNQTKKTRVNLYKDIDWTTILII